MSTQAPWPPSIGPGRYGQFDGWCAAAQHGVAPDDRPLAGERQSVGHVKSQARAGFAKRQYQRVRKYINLIVIVIY